MKSLPFLAMALFLFFGAYRYVMLPHLVKRDFPEHFIGKSPIWLVRAVGIAFAVGGLCFCYLAANA
jgi:hypothetical protein